MAQRPQSRPAFPPAETLGGLNGGLDGYTDVTLAPWKRWIASLNVFSSMAGNVQRARWANIVNGTGGGYTAQGSIFTTFKYYAVPGLSSYLLADTGGKLWSFDSGANYAAVQRFNPYFNPTGSGTADTTPAPALTGPWSREVLQNISYEMNGGVKQTGRGANAATVEGWGLDAPDSSPDFGLSAGTSQNIVNIQRTGNIVTVNLAAALTVPAGNGIGMVNVTITIGDTSFAGTFVMLTGNTTATLTWFQLGQNTGLLTPTGTVNTNITKSVGRSYAWAWENANKPIVSAPSPSSQFIQFTNQNANSLQLIQPGDVNSAGGTTLTSSLNAIFTPAWVGRRIYIPAASINARILSVPNSTTMIVDVAVPVVANAFFQIYDPQATHIRLYATADGGATYFRIQRNTWNPNDFSGATLGGLRFFDTANSEPPSFPFTTETSQLNNVPPPVGSFVAEYQGRLVVFGVPGAFQSFFYSNLELTSIGLPQESFAPLNQYTLPIQNAKLNGWIEMPGSAIIWSDRQDMFRLTGNLVDNSAANTAQQLGAQIARLPYNLGCVNPYAVDITPLGAIWVTPQAEVWLFTDRYAPRNIGRPIQNLLNSISTSSLANIRCRYYHNNTRNWFIIACGTNGSSTNNTLLILDLDLLSSNGSPSFFVFDMAQNQPSWYQYQLPSSSLEVLYEPSGLVRLLTGGVDLVRDADFSNGFGTEIAVTNAGFTTHAWGSDAPAILKRPTWMRFNTNRDPSSLASDGWSFQALGIDDDYYTFAFPLSLTMTPGVNDTQALGGNPNLTLGSPFRTSAELFRIGGVNFVMGKRIQFVVNFPSTPGVTYQLRQIQLGFAPSPPR